MHLYPVQRPAPYQRASNAFFACQRLFLGVMAVWALFVLGGFAAFMGTGFYLDHVAAVPSNKIDKIMFRAAFCLAGYFFLMSTINVGVFHARAVDMLAGRPVNFGSFFSFRGALRPSIAYVASKSLVLMWPVLWFYYAATTGLLDEGEVAWTTMDSVLSIVCLVMIPIVYYFTLWVTVAATDMSILAAFETSFKIATTCVGGTWLHILVNCLCSFFENITLNLGMLFTVPFKSLATVSKYQELVARIRPQLPAQNLPGGTPGYPVY